jgi:hypothetical protein
MNGWHDPIWKQLYGGSPSPLEVTGGADPHDPPVVDYTTQLQQAAAAGQTLNLSDLPGYQTNLRQPGDG